MKRFLRGILCLSVLALSLSACGSGSSGGVAGFTNGGNNNNGGPSGNPGGAIPVVAPDLLALTSSAGTLSPVFDTAVTSYTLNIDFSVNAVSVTPTVGNASLAIQVNGFNQTSGTASAPIDVSGAPPPNILVSVHAPSGNSKTYAIFVLREGEPSLRSLTLSAGALSPPFSSGVTSYSLRVNFLDSKVSLTPFTTYVSHTVRVNGIAHSSGVASPLLPLIAGTPTTIAIEVRTPGGSTKTYTLSVRRDAVGDFAQNTYAKASNTGANDRFGLSVAFSGNTLVVGASGEDSNATGINGLQTNNSASASGAVYVFVRSGSTWSQQAYLKASNTAAADGFGDSVAISGDTIVVGASDEDSNATGINGLQTNNGASASGAAYVFVRSGSTWSQQGYLKASNTAAADGFGSSVQISGDTIAVGALGEDSNATGINGLQTNNGASASGAAYVFVRSGSTWTQQAYVKASNTAAGDGFGTSLALYDETLVVGASGEDSNATGVNGLQTNNGASASGAAYVFVRSGSTWTQQAYVKASNTAAADGFGASLALSSETLVIGASGEDSNATSVNGNQTNNGASASGAAYVFVRNASTWTQQAYLKPTNTGAEDGFGESVAISGDTLVVGASAEDSNATGINGTQINNSASASGAAYVFIRTGANWTQQAYLKASNTSANDQFGSSVAIANNTILVGAFAEDSNAKGIGGLQTNNTAANSGAVYLFQ